MSSSAAAPPAAAAPAGPAATPIAAGPNGTQPLQGQALTDAIVFQVEYYLSRENLSRDTYLQSQMDADQFVSLELLASFKKLKTLSSDVGVIAAALRGSRLVELDESEKRVKPRPRPQRNTIILREIPSDAAPETVQALFAGEGAPRVQEIRPEVGDNWFVVLESEESALEALNWLRSQLYNGEPVRARMKTESTMLRSYFVPGGGATRPVVPFVPSGAVPFYAPQQALPAGSPMQPWDYQQQAAAAAAAAAPGQTGTGGAGGARYGGRDRRYNNNSSNGDGGRGRGRKASPTRGGAKSAASGPRSGSASGGANAGANKGGRSLPRPEPELTLAQFPPLASDTAASATAGTAASAPDATVAPAAAGAPGHYVAPKPGGGYGERNFTRHHPELVARIAAASNAGASGPPATLASLRTTTSGPLTEAPAPLQNLLMAGHETPSAWAAGANKEVASPPRKGVRPVIRPTASPSAPPSASAAALAEATKAQPKDSKQPQAPPQKSVNEEAANGATKSAAAPSASQDATPKAQTPAPADSGPKSPQQEPAASTGPKSWAQIAKKR